VEASAGGDGFRTAGRPSCLAVSPRAGRCTGPAGVGEPCAGQRRPVRQRCGGSRTPVSVSSRRAGKVAHAPEGAFPCLRGLAPVRREPPQEDAWSTPVPATPRRHRRRRRHGGGTRRRGLWRRGRQEACGQQRADRGEDLPTARAQEAVGTDCGEPAWEDRREEAMEARVNGQGQPVPPDTVSLLEAVRGPRVAQQASVRGGSGIERSCAPVPQRTWTC